MIASDTATKILLKLYLEQSETNMESNQLRTIRKINPDDQLNYETLFHIKSNHIKFHIKYQIISNK